MKDLVACALLLLGNDAISPFMAMRNDERFWARVRKADGDGCWEWTGGRLPKGYGLRWRRGERERLTHRLSWIMTHGPIPDGLCVLHKCDNPPCVRPDHLFLGTRADNIHDMDRKGRRVRKGLVGEVHHKAKLSDEDVRAIRDAYSYRKVTLESLAAKYGVSFSAIHCVVKRITWRHVQ